MKLFKSLLVAPATLGLLAPLSVSANQVNIKDISNYSDIENVDLANSFDKEESIENTFIAGGEGLVDTSTYNGGFSETTTASFGADFVVGAVDGDSTSEATTFDYQFGMNLSTSFTGEDSLDLTIETGNAASASSTALNMNGMSDAMTLDESHTPSHLVTRQQLWLETLQMLVLSILHLVYIVLSLIYLVIVVQEMLLV